MILSKWKKNDCVIYAAIAILCQWRSLLTSVVRAWTTRNCQTGSWTLVAVNALGLSEVNRWSVFVLVKSSLSWRRKMGDKEQNIFMAKLAEQAERYEGKGGGFRRHRWVISVTIAYESWSVVVLIRQKAALRAFYYQFDVSTVTGFLFHLEVSLPRYPLPDIFACWREMISSGFLFLANECLIHNMRAWSSIFVSHLLALVLLPRSLGRKATSLVIFFVLSYAKSVVYVCLLLFAQYLGFVGFLGENFVYGLFLTSC